MTAKKKPAKKKPAKKKKRKIRTARDAAWMWFSRYIRLRDSLATTGTTTSCVCVTCGGTFPTSSSDRSVVAMQAGHAIDGRGRGILFDEEIVNGQCRNCNVMHNGRLPEYAVHMCRKHSIDWYDERIQRARGEQGRWTLQELDEIRDHYKALVEKINEEKGN